VSQEKKGFIEKLGPDYQQQYNNLSIQAVLALQRAIADQAAPPTTLGRVPSVPAKSLIPTPSLSPVAKRQSAKARAEAHTHRADLT
jgi:hypothetical protein